MTRLFELPVGKSHEFLLALQNQGLTLEQAEEVTNDPEKAALMVNALRPAPLVYRLAQFTPLLYSLYEQTMLLEYFRTNVPDELSFPKSWLTSLDTTSTHVQSVDDLEFFFVVLDTLEKTWNFNQWIINWVQPSISDTGFGRDETQLRLDGTAVRYEPGVHRIRINLVDNWPSLTDPSVDRVRANASASGKKLAGIETIGAYGLQNPKLLRAQDGVMLPYCNLAGLQQGISFNKVPYFFWSFHSKGVVEFHSQWSGYVNVEDSYASPTLVKY